MKIYGFYHIFCINDYLELIENQLSKIKESNLINRTNILYLGVNGTQKNVIEIENINHMIILNSPYGKA